MLVSAIAASVGMAAIRIISVQLTEASQAADLVLLLPPVDVTDLFNAAIVPIVLLLEFYRNGWQGSALRRLLSRDDPSTRTDLFYFAFCATGLNTVFSILLTLGASQYLGALADSTIGPRPGAELPLIAAVPAMLVAQSFVVYWYHRLMHTPLFWPLHAVHHAADDFNVVTSNRNHPLDAFAYAIAISLTEAVCGFPPAAVMVAVMIIYLYTTYIHGDLPGGRWMERWLVFGPNGHGIHHGRDPSCYNSNFGDLVIWDQLFGTYKIEVKGPMAYGCADPDGIYQSGRPLRDMAAVQIVWLRGLCDAVNGMWVATAKTGAMGSR
jgi:sterol desaturase/sphingolipid hydroxylase (fatty acid hydroxylase superfamily)